MSEVTREEIRNIIERKVLDAIRILRPGDDPVHAAHNAFAEISQKTKDSIFGHAAVSVEALFINERRADPSLNRKAEVKVDESESGADLTDFLMDDEAAEALGEILRITAWTQTRAINEALKFMRKALQFEAVSQ